LPSQLDFVLFIWRGAASVKLNHHFPSFVSVMITTRLEAARFKANARYVHHPTPTPAPVAQAAFSPRTRPRDRSFTLPILLFRQPECPLGTLVVIGMKSASTATSRSTFPLGSRLRSEPVP